MLSDAAKPRVSRETRRLLAAAGLALLALWILARLRFPDLPASPNPVSPVLTQIARPTTFADLADEVEEVRRRIAPLLSGVPWQGIAASGGARVFPAWPLGDGLAIAVLPPANTGSPRDGIVARDSATGLALVRTTGPAAATGPIWTPDRLELSRYVFAAAPAPSQPSVGPAYISSFEPQRSPAWSTSIWRVPAASGLIAGTFIFTAASEWLGIAAEEDGQPVIVPAAALLDRAMRMRSQQEVPPGDLGIHVQGLDPSLARATGATTGVIVAWVDPQGASATAVAVGDVIEQVNNEPVPALFAWQVHSSRLAPGMPAILHVRRRGEAREVTIDVPPPPTVHPDVLGLTLARVPRVGSRVTRVEPGTAADRAGLQAGDVVTLAGEEAAPTPAQVRRAFEALPDGGAVLLAITRAMDHRLVTLTR